MILIFFIKILHSKCTLQNGHHTQCDQIGRFLNVLRNKFACKSSPKYWRLYWAVLTSFTLCKTTVASLWATFGTIWATFLLQYLVTLIVCHLLNFKVQWSLCPLIAIESRFVACRLQHKKKHSNLSKILSLIQHVSQLI